MSTVATLGINDLELSLFNELNEVIAKYENVTRKFGVTLEHDHFPLNANETLHETHDAEARTMKVEVINKDLIPENTMITQWSLTPEGPKPSMYCCTLS